MSQMDEQLASEAYLIMVEIEMEDGEIHHDWLMDVEYRAQQRAQDYIQVWDLHSGESVKTPNLGNHDLEPFYGDFDEMIYRSITLPNGSMARAVGVKIAPTTPVGYSGSISPKDKPQIMVLARDSKAINKGLRELKFYLIAVLIIVNLAIILSGFLIIRKVLKPLNKVVEAVAEVDPTDVNSKLNVPCNIPAELTELVSHYQNLLEKVNHSRRRERDFTSNVAHELRTPISGLLSIAEACLLKPRSSEEYQLALQKTEAVGEDMKLLVERIMSLMHLENSKQELTQKPVMIDEMLRQVTQHEITAHNAEVKIIWQLAADTQLMCEPSYLKMMLRNIIGNAIQYTSDGKVTISSKRQPDRVTVTVCNASSGIDQAALERIKEPFVRMDSSRALDGHSGLGIPLILELAALLDIELNYSITQSGEFMVTLDIPLNPS